MFLRRVREAANLFAGDSLELSVGVGESSRETVAIVRKPVPIVVVIGCGGGDCGARESGGRTSSRRATN